MLKVYTDGGCLGNPGPGGWAFAIYDGDKLITSQSGGEKDTTNNRMELTAVTRALEYAIVNGIAELEILTDSQYVKNGITVWISSWKKKAWRTAGGSPVKNKEYWERLDSLNSSLKVTWSWVKGHAGVEGNELCDSLVREESSKFLQ